MLPCRRELNFQKKNVFSTLRSKKVSRSVLGAPRNSLKGSLEAPGGVPKTPPEQAQAPPEVPSAADRRARRLHMASGAWGGSTSAPYGSPFRRTVGLKAGLYGERRGSPNDYGVGTQEDNSSSKRRKHRVFWACFRVPQAGKGSWDSAEATRTHSGFETEVKCCWGALVTVLLYTRLAPSPRT